MFVKGAPGQNRQIVGDNIFKCIVVIFFHMSIKKILDFFPDGSVYSVSVIL